MDSNKLLPIEPKQSRSKKKFENILNSAEEILIQDKSVLTFISLSIHSKYKRASIYKYFPSIESLYLGILFRHEGNFLKLLQNNFKDKLDLDLDWYLKIYIDLLAIYLDKNKHLRKVFNMCEVISKNQPSVLTATANQDNTFCVALMTCLNELEIEYPEFKVRMSALIGMTVLLNYMPRYSSPIAIAEAKKACLAYFYTP
tara:strand:- start:75 stop:674 length:600 start_codon:yes stop_codon:yes gene_type:complete